MLQIIMLVLLAVIGGLVGWGFIKQDYPVLVFGCILLIGFGMILEGEGVEKVLGSKFEYDVSGNLVNSQFIYSNINAEVDPSIGALRTFAQAGGIVGLLIGSIFWINQVRRKN